MFILSWRNLAVFSINLDCGNISNGVDCDSISCSIPDKGFAGACFSVDLGHSSGGKSLNTSLIALSKDKVSISVSDPESLECLDLFDFLLRESEDVDVEEEDVESDLRLLLCLDLCLFLD